MPKNLPTALLLTAATLLLAACSDSVKDTHPQQLVSKRQAIFKKMTQTLEPMGQVARERKDYDKGEFLASALELQKLSGQPWALFTADGNYPPTRARPEVWQKAAEFRQAQDSFQLTLAQLVKVAASADLPAIRNAVNEVEKSCKNCHGEFRRER